MRIFLGGVAAAIVALGLVTSSLSDAGRCEMATSLPAHSPDRISAHGCATFELARQAQTELGVVVLAKTELR
jgi:hypothetical protein